MRNANYAVIVNYSFDEEVSVRLFESFIDAKKHLESDWRKEIFIDIEENYWDSEYEISDDGCYAKIINHFADRDDVTEWRIGNVHERMEVK